MPERTDPKGLEESTRRWVYAGLILLGLFIAVFPIYRLYEPGRRADARETQASFLADQGSEIFASNCSSCHGEAGRGGIGPALGASEFLESVDDDQMAQLIALGIPGTEMVSYSIDYGGPFTSAEIDAVTAYLRSLEEDAPSNPIWRTPLADENLFGRDLFAMACARCHGIDRKGIEDVAPDLSDTSFALEESDDWLADRITNGYQDMPRFGGVLTDDQVAVLVAYLRGIDTNMPTTTTTTTTTTTSTTATPGPTTTGDPSTSTTTTAPVTTTTEDPLSDILALGKEVFDVTAGGEGCANCHGFDAQGTNQGPNIIGASKSAISGALGGGIIDMSHIELTAEELEAVYQYLLELTRSR